MSKIPGYDDPFRDQTSGGFGQISPLTVTLRNVLRDYSGAQILNELLQNADDAGASVFKVLYDRRTSPHATATLLSPSMIHWAGPALYAFDDASFRPEDFASIQRVGDGRKRGDPTKTGQVKYISYHFNYQSFLLNLT